jgi:CheY-like chemotaxis protein
MAARPSIFRFRDQKGNYGEHKQTGACILMVEDDPKDLELTLTALEENNLANEVIVTRDGEQAVDYLYCRGEYKTRSGGNPTVMLLDLKLPKVDGLDVLKQI